MSSTPDSPNPPPFGGGTPRADGPVGRDFSGAAGAAGGGGSTGGTGGRGGGWGNGQGPRGSAGPYVDPSCTAEERTYGLFMHLVGLLALTSVPVPVAGLIGTAIMWKIKGDTSPYLDDHGRDAVNFQLSLLLYSVVLAILIIPTFGLSTLGHIGTAVVSLVGCIRGARASNRGEYFRYPMTIRFLKEG